MNDQRPATTASTWPSIVWFAVAQFALVIGVSAVDQLSGLDLGYGSVSTLMSIAAALWAGWNFVTRVGRTPAGYEVTKLVWSSNLISFALAGAALVVFAGFADGGISTLYALLTDFEEQFTIVGLFALLAIALLVQALVLWGAYGPLLRLMTPGSQRS